VSPVWPPSLQPGVGGQIGIENADSSRVTRRVSSQALTQMIVAPPHASLTTRLAPNPIEDPFAVAVIRRAIAAQRVADQTVDSEAIAFIGVRLHAI
jgi:hypothetical protein